MSNSSLSFVTAFLITAPHLSKDDALAIHCIFIFIGIVQTILELRK